MFAKEDRFMDNVIVNKAASIERCLQRVEEEYQAAGDEFHQDFSRQDAAILNLLRACEQAIDLANYVIKSKKLGIPQTSRESFELLRQNDLIPEGLEKKLKAMVGFRNIAIHNYTKLEMPVVISIIEHHLDDFRSLVQLMLRLTPGK